VPWSEGCRASKKLSGIVKEKRSAGEAERQAVNQSIRTSGEFDEAIDFEAVVRIRHPVSHIDLPPAQIRSALFIHISLIFSKFFYLESMRSYFTFYLISNSMSG
jgi:hypothetical protein